MNKKRVYIIGAGYAGIKALTQLAKIGNIELSLLDKNSYHYLQTDVYDYLAGMVNLADVSVDLYTLCHSFERNITFLQENVLRVDFEKNSIITEHTRYTYDYLILSSGAQTMLLDSIEGLKDNFHGIKSLGNALAFKQRFEQNIFNKLQSEGKCSRESTYSIVIAGAGLSGVEIAAQMADYAKEFYKDAGYLCSNVDITLINSKKMPLPSNSSFMQKQAAKRLRQLGVKIITDSHVTKVEPKSVTLNHTDKIDMDFLIWTAGIMPSKLTNALDVKKSKRGQILVDSFYRLMDYSNVFAIGDNAQLFNPSTNEMLPPTAQTAELAASYVASNINNIIAGKELVKQSIKPRGFLASLGGRYGAAELFESIKLSGFIAYFLKKSVEKNYKNPLRKKCKEGYQNIMNQK